MTTNNGLPLLSMHIELEVDKKAQKYRWRGSLSHTVYCVYAHRVDGIIFYIGMGTPTRPFSLGRNKAWMEIVSERGGYDLEIIEWFGTKGAALAKEKELIGIHSPIANFSPDRERRKAEAEKSPPVCSNCHLETSRLVRGLCLRCYNYHRNLGRDRPPVPGLIRHLREVSP